jgi:phasin family protein
MSTQKTTQSTKQAKEAAKLGAESVEQAVKAGTEALNTGYAQAMAMTKEQVSTYFPSAAKGFDEFAGLGKDNLDAAFEFGSVAAKGFEAISKEFMAFNQKALEANMEKATALLGCKTVQDLVEVQTDIARGNFDEFVAQGTKITEISVKAANEAVGPISVRVNDAVEKFVKTATV